MKKRKFMARLLSFAVALLMILPLANTVVLAQEEEGETYVFESNDAAFDAACEAFKALL